MPISSDIKTSKEERKGGAEEINEAFFDRPEPKRIKRKTNKKLIRLIVILVVVVAVLTGGIVFLSKKFKGSAGQANSDYYAVFLANDQVYFGHLSAMKSDYPVLNEIYYLRLNQDLQQQKESERTMLQNSELALIKLGTELHGPVDEMIINKNQIMFFERLGEDSKVVAAIEEYKKEKK